MSYAFGFIAGSGASSAGIQRLRSHPSLSRKTPTMKPRRDMWFPILRSLDSATGNDLPSATNRDKPNNARQDQPPQRSGLR